VTIEGMSRYELQPTPTLVATDLSGGVLTLTLDSPANRNALSRQLVAELGALLGSANDDPQVRVVVLTHTGGTFCSGADLADMSSAAGATESMRALLGLLVAIVDLPKPVVALVDGHARAGGLGLIGACDIAIAGPNATFAFSEARLGLAPAVISLVTLPRMTPRPAQRYLLTGDVFNSDEAVQTGLITETGVEPVQLLRRCLTSLLAGSGQGLAHTKALTTLSVRALLAEHGGSMVALSGRLFGSPEAQEGMAARREKRSPAWLDGS
jgi:enoyl-CoA hydratase